ILYHGPRNDLPCRYSAKEVSDMLNAKKDSVMCVRGNCDAEVDQMMLDFPIMADYCLLYLKNRLVFATHGHLYDTSHLPPLSAGDILLHGHTHVPAWEVAGKILYINPGSVSIPKKNSPNSYMVLTDSVFFWKDLDGKIYHEMRF
ncbi:MAG: phosphodiesterase, partial [Mailhella sp.]|nr:phosphodiesterase [Mailhella sp.]